MHRRCNYDRVVAEYAHLCVETELVQRSVYGNPSHEDVEEFMTDKIRYYLEQYNRSTLADIVIMPYLDQATVTCLSTEHLQALAGILTGMLQYQPFELITVHDDFKAHANNINWVRYQYKEILAEIADSNVLDDLLTQLHGTPGVFNKLSCNLGDQIRGSSYALC